jgi:hypothetical protein
LPSPPWRDDRGLAGSHRFQWFADCNGTGNSEPDR